MRCRPLEAGDCVAVLTALRPGCPPPFHRGCCMYLLYLDESGTHGGSPCFILAGLAVPESDAWHLQNRLMDTLQHQLPQGFDPNAFELHAAEIKHPTRPRRPSPWAAVPLNVRIRVLHSIYESIAGYEPIDVQLPVTLFGAVVDRRTRDRVARGYEEVLHKFDEMLRRRSSETLRHVGLAIHDKHYIERDVQRAADTWRHIAGRLGTLNHLADVPLFADSRASRLIQAADFVAWALWKAYGAAQPDNKWIDKLWQMFDADGGVMHGLTHVSPEFARGCTCPPCASRR